eukprot:1876090-Rhodomonas_salina.3
MRQMRCVCFRYRCVRSSQTRRGRRRDAGFRYGSDDAAHVRCVHAHREEAQTADVARGAGGRAWRWSSSWRTSSWLPAASRCAL